MVRRFCPVYQFKPRVRYRHDLLLPASLYGIAEPADLSGYGAPAPFYISPEDMLERLRSRPGGSGGGLGVVHGLTVADFSVRFSDPARQWRHIPSRRAWQFRGGDVFLDVDIAVYVLEGDRPTPGDDASSRIFAVIMEHELEHVADEIDIVKRWMPRHVPDDPVVRRYLSHAEPASDSMFRDWFRGSRFEDRLRNEFWAPEHNRRSRIRDAPDEYRALQERIDELRIQQTNRPRPAGRRVRPGGGRP